VIPPYSAHELGQRRAVHETPQLSFRLQQQPPAGCELLSMVAAVCV